MAAFFSVDDALLNESFAGYKLAGDPHVAVLAVHDLHGDARPLEGPLLQAADMSLARVTARVKHNHLAAAPDGSAFYVGAGSALMHVTPPQPPRAVCTLPLCPTPSADRRDVSVACASPFVLVCDGSGTVFIVHAATGECSPALCVGSGGMELLAACTRPDGTLHAVLTAHTHAITSAGRATLAPGGPIHFQRGSAGGGQRGGGGGDSRAGGGATMHVDPRGDAAERATTQHTLLSVTMRAREGGGAWHVVHTTRLHGVKRPLQCMHSSDGAVWGVVSTSVFTDPHAPPPAHAPHAAPPAAPTSAALPEDMDADLLARATAMLAKYTSEDQTSPFAGKIFSLDGPEEDGTEHREHENTLLQVFGGERADTPVHTHRLAHHDWITGHGRTLALKADVDMLVCTLTDDLAALTHTATFPALDYLIRAKPNCKLVQLALPHAVVLADAHETVHMYEQPGHARSGVYRYTAVGDRSTELLGVCCTNRTALVMTPEQLTVLRTHGAGE